VARVRLGVNNCFAVKRWPEPREWAEIVSHELGLKLVQFSYDLLDPRSPKPVIDLMVEEIRDAVREYGLELHSTFTGLAAYSFNLLGHPNPVLRADAFDWYSRAIGVAGELGALATGGHVAAMSHRDWSSRRERVLEEIVSLVASLTSIARRAGLKMLLWEPMPVPREPPHTIREAKDILKKLDSRSRIPVRLCIDLGHACAWHYEEERDLDPYAWLRELAPLSPAMHVQQTDGKADRHWPFTDEYNRLGIIRPDKVLEAIDESGASEVLLFLEIIHPFEARDDKVLEDLKRSVEYWRDYVPA